MRAARHLMIVAMAAGMLAGVSVQADELGTQLKQRVGEVLAGKRPLAEVRIDVLWAHAGSTSLTVFGSGVGIWSREKQFELSPDQHKKLLEKLVERDFFSMPERPKPTPEPQRAPQGAMVLRSVTLRVGDLERTVLQTSRVQPLPALESLASELFGLCEKAAGKAIRAVSLADGLGKVAKGELALETLAFTFNIPPVAASGSQPAQDGEVVSLEGGVVTWTVLVAGQPPVPVRLAPATDRLRALADLINRLDFSAFPVNLYRSRYVEVGVSVLNHSHTSMARAFVGLDPGKHAAQQEALEKMIEAVLALKPSGGAAPASAPVV